MVAFSVIRAICSSRMVNLAVFKNKIQETTMFKKSIFITATLVATLGALSTANADTTRDHRCFVGQGKYCQAIPPLDYQVHQPSPARQPIGPFGYEVLQPDAGEPCDPRVCEPPFDHGRPHRPRPVVIIDPIDMGSSHWGITCGQGRNIVRHSGYRRVRVIDCSGRKFTYSGTRHGEVFGVVVNRRGRIVDVFGAP